MTRIAGAGAAAAAAAKNHVEADRLLGVRGDPVIAAQLLDSANRHADEASKLVAEELLAAAELDLGTLSNLLHEDFRDEIELRAAAAKLLDVADGAAGDTWRSHTDRRAESRRRSGSALRTTKDQNALASLTDRLHARVTAMYSRSA